VAIAIVALASVMGAAGALKLLIPEHEATLASRLASHNALARFAVSGLPIAEIGLAAALVPPVTRPAAAVACLLLLILFSVVLIRAWRAGDLTPCGCFGSTGARPNHASSAVRNVLLGLLAIEILVIEPVSLDPLTLGLMVLSTTAVGVAGVLARDLRASAVPSVQLPSVTDLGPALDFPLTMTGGARTTVREWLAEGRAQLVVFVDPICGPCRSILPVLGRWQQTTSRLALRIVSRGPIDENVAMVREFGLAPIAVQATDGLSVRFGVTATPTALLLSTEGRLMADPALGKAAIVALLEGVEASISAQTAANGALAI
jgi:thiol-disulfide isomerase/thioredoxin